MAILEKSYIGSGAAGRNTTIIRPTTARPRERSSTRRASSSTKASAPTSTSTSSRSRATRTLPLDRGIITANERAEVNQLLGIDSRVIYPDEIAELCPEMDLSEDVTWPVVAALYHPPGGIIRHDAVVWGYARGADRQGIEIHPHTEVTGIERSNGRVTGVDTTRGHVKTDMVVSATAGWSTLVADFAGVPLPITTHILQAFVTEPVKPFDVVVVSSQMHVYVSQTDRGEFLIGAEIEPYTTTAARARSRSSVLGAHVLELFPQLERVRVLRSWTGLCDLSPDYSPILGKTELHGFLVSTGWGTYGSRRRADRRHDARGARRHRRDARADRAVRARALPHRHPRVRAGRRGRLALVRQRASHMATQMPSSLEIAQEATLRPVSEIGGAGPRARRVRPVRQVQGQGRPLRRGAPRRPARREARLT